ncbi:hypothetical protein HYV44_03330 [Candidatus Microgenomates bacterium]|nr:hypothetical protein [Candidatus Microgenomates bacterium]
MANQLKDDEHRAAHESAIIERAFAVWHRKNDTKQLVQALRSPAVRNEWLRRVTRNSNVALDLENYCDLIGMVDEEDSKDRVNETIAVIKEAFKNNLDLPPGLTLADLCELAEQVRDPFCDGRGSDILEEAILARASGLLTTTEDAIMLANAFLTRTGIHRTIRIFLQAHKWNEELLTEELVKLAKLVQTTEFGGIEALTAIFGAAEARIVRCNTDTPVEELENIAYLLAAEEAEVGRVAAAEDYLNTLVLERIGLIDPAVKFVKKFRTGRSRNAFLRAFVGRWGIQSQEDAVKLASCVKEYEGALSGETKIAIVDAAKAGNVQDLDVTAIVNANQASPEGHSSELGLATKGLLEEIMATRGGCDDPNYSVHGSGTENNIPRIRFLGIGMIPIT